MSDFRARDADRDRAVSVIRGAYAEGQLGDADRDLRVGRARAAETLDELAGLTRDLRVPAVADVAPAPSPHSYVPDGPAARRPARSGRALAAIAIAVVALLGLGVASTVLATFSGSVDPSSGESSAPVVESVDVEADGGGFAMGPGQVRRLLTSYERRFGTLESYSVVLNSGRAIVEVPVTGPQPRQERWLYDGSWRQLAKASALLSSAQVVDLGALDVRQMFANITKAERNLNVENGRLTHVVVHRWNHEVATVNIYVANMFDETGYLSTTLSGERIVRRFPYQS